jgi:predicted TIM-barrel fold metal-dependent hydrolase
VGWDGHVHVFDGEVAVAGGHYRPAHRPLAQIESAAARHGVGHLVLVQPSVYGHDNGLLLQALATTPGRHRGVVVIDAATLPADLSAMQALGVRGARLNRVSPVGEQGPVTRRFEALAPVLRRQGWHLQWYVRPEHLAEVAALHAGSGVVCVLDHLGGMGAGIADDHPGWQALARLAGEGGWVKLSGWYRLGDTAPYAALLPTVRRLAGLFGERVVWGSDWPHTGFADDALPSYASTWQPVADALGARAAQSLRSRPPSLYA